MLKNKKSKNGSSTIKTNQIKIFLGLISYFIILIGVFIILLWLFSDIWLVWLVILMGIIVFSIILLVNWHRQNFTYKCEFCEYEFRISFLLDLLSPHGPNRKGGWKYLKCPKCNKRSKVAVIKNSTNISRIDHNLTG